MRRSAVLVAVLVVQASLSGCESLGTGGGTQASGESTGSIAAPPAGSADPKDPVEVGKAQFREKNYGLAEQSFRRAVEKTPQNAEGWLGLAASYDELRRFDLADRAYAELARVHGASVELLNNRGYSYMLRGDLAKARKDLLSAQVLDPENPWVANNLRLLKRRLAGTAR